MLARTLFVALFPLITRAANVVLSNDDGWAEINIRTFYNTLTAAGDSVVLSAPAENESGTGIYQPFSPLDPKRNKQLFTKESSPTRLTRRARHPAHAALRVQFLPRRFPAPR